MIQVDISNIWGEISLGDLLNAEREVFDAHKTLTEGTGAGKEYLGWLDLPVESPSEEMERILAAAEKIRRDSEVCVVVGIGCGCTGARAVIELLQGPNHNIGKGRGGDPQIFFAGNNASTRHWNELCRLMEGKNISVIVISKSGDTLEPAIAFRNLRWILERKYGTDGANSRIYAITDADHGVLRQMAEEEGWESFTIPGNVGDGFSVLSPVGLLPMAVAGIDIGALMRGAWEAKQEFDLRSFENPVWLYAAVRNLLYRGGKTIEVMESLEPGFQMMGHWWQQLFAASEGKDGKGIFPATAELTADLYSLGQMIQEGQRNLFETMIRFDMPETPVVIGENVKNLDGLNYIAGKSLDFVEAMAFEGTVSAHTDSNVPVLTVDCGSLNERTVGALIHFFQLSCGISAYVLGVNPFDQNAVEAYIANMFRLLGKPGYESL